MSSESLQSVSREPASRRRIQSFNSHLLHVCLVSIPGQKMQGALITLARHTPPPSNKRQTTFSSIYVHLSRSPHKCKNEKIFYVVTEHFDRGSSPKFPPLGSFFVRELSSLRFFALLVKSPQRTTARRFSRIGDGTLTPLSWRTTPTLELHPLQRGNRYMSRRYGVTHSNARAVSLADFGFALIPARNSHAAPPTEDECSPTRLVRTAIPSSSRVPHVPPWHQSFPQHTTVE
jgi:hypothetical protein